MPIHGRLNKKPHDRGHTNRRFHEAGFPSAKQSTPIEVWVSAFAMLLLILVVSIQVFCRYVLQDSLAWTEELARYLVIWSVLFGCSFAMRTDSHLELSILPTFPAPA